MDLCKTCLEDIKPFVRLIDRKDLITEADLDDEPEMDGDGADLFTEGLDEFIDVHSEYSREDYDER